MVQVKVCQVTAAGEGAVLLWGAVRRRQQPRGELKVPQLLQVRQYGQYCRRPLEHLLPLLLFLLLLLLLLLLRT
jgi:hypothetical protein